MSAEPIPRPRRVATYERVSSEDQRERETIRTQTDELARRLAQESGITLVGRYSDDGVSGMVPLAERPGGARLLQAAAAGEIDEVHVLKLDRLGRDEIDRFVVRRRLRDLGVRLRSVLEGEPDDLSYGMHTVMDGEVRRRFLELVAIGTNRAAREGRYCGGIVPYGYRVEGERPKAHLMPDETVLWADLSAADVVRRVYRRLALDHWSCRQIADELNALGIPPHYTRDGRGVRGQRTRGVWRAGRIRNMVVQPAYRGERLYGRRSTKRDRKVIAAPIEALVSEKLWQAAQETLARNRLCAKNTPRIYLMRGVIECGSCGLKYVASHGRDAVIWYRCNGRMRDRGPLEGSCRGRALRGDWIEQTIWADIERWLRDPGDILDELDGSREREAATAIAEAESVTLNRALDQLAADRSRAQRLAVRGSLTDDELDLELARIADERAGLERRLAEVRAAPEPDPVPAEALDLLETLRQRLDRGLSDAERQEITRLLVNIVVHSEPTPDGEPHTRVLVTYRFPGAVQTFSGTPAGQNYTVVRRVVELPSGRQRARVAPG